MTITATDFLIRLRILDADGTLSLTSLFFMVAMVKFALEPMQTEILVALLGAAATYSGKKVINQRAPTAELKATVAALQTEHADTKARVQMVENRTRPAGGGR